MKKIYIPIMTPTILAAAILGAGPGVAEVQAAEPSQPQQIEHFDLSWSTDLGGGTVETVDLDGITKYFALPDGRVSLSVHSRLRVVTTENGVVVKEVVWRQNDQLRLDFGQDFVYRSFERIRSTADDTNCLTRVVFHIAGPNDVEVRHESSGPDC